MHVGKTTISRAGSVAAVHLTLAHRYVCANKGTADQPCHPDVQRMPDIIYLVLAGGHWLVLKPGLVFRASEIDAAEDDESVFYPPGNASTVRGAARLGAPPQRCPATTIAAPGVSVAVSDATHLRSRAPWLAITRLAIARLDRGTVCFELTLAAPPRADSDYSIGLGVPGQPDPADLFDVQIDGVGRPHVLIRGEGRIENNPPGVRIMNISRYLPQIGLDGRQLDIISRDFPAGHRFDVTADSSSLQSDEPVLRHPLNAGHHIPTHGCLKFPSGKLTFAGLCGGG
ncbi:MAG TPA: hypothetical protein VHX66_18075 [Solirubrobacteraceae bacterium]|nr:hypothetical protein [Solirubrobacteraceae bacterium]